MLKYELIVGNIGTVLSTNDLAEALKEFQEYAELSKSHYGRASNEFVALFEDGDILAEYSPYAQNDD